MSWINILIAIFSSPAVQEMLKELWAWILQRLQKRFGPVTATNFADFSVEMSKRLDAAPGELYWWQFAKRRAIRRMASHAKSRMDDLWRAHVTGMAPFASTETFVIE